MGGGKRHNQRHGCNAFLAERRLHTRPCLLYTSQDGRIRAQGLPEQIITPELVRSVYDVELEIREVDGKPFVIPV